MSARPPHLTPEEVRALARGRLITTLGGVDQPGTPAIHTVRFLAETRIWP